MADCSDDESSSDSDSDCDNEQNSGKNNFFHDASSSNEEEGYIPPNPYVSCFLFLFCRCVKETAQYPENENSI